MIQMAGTMRCSKLNTFGVRAHSKHSYARSAVTVETRWDEKTGLRRDAVRCQVIDVLKAQIKRRPAMKKVSTAAGSATGTESEHDSQGDARGVRKHAALSHRAGDGNALSLSLGESTVERTGARSDRGACAQRAFDRRESEEGRPAGCADAGAVGANRSAVVVSGETSQRESTGGSDGDSGTSWVGASADGAGRHTRAGQEFRRAAARMHVRNMNPEKAKGLSPELQTALQPLLAAILAFNRIVVVRYRMYLESRHLAANTINQQLAAVRRLAHEAADAGLLSPELAAGISRGKGVKQLGFRSGNWLSAEQSSEVLKHAHGSTMRARRDYAMLAMLFGCVFRRSELVGLELDEIQMRQGLGRRRPDRQGRPHPHGAHSTMGQGSPRSVDSGSHGHRGKDLSTGCQNGKGMGERHLAECRVVCSQELLRKGWLAAHRPA